MTASEGTSRFDAGAILSALDALDSKSGPDGRDVTHEAVTSFLSAASVLHVFNPETLQAYGSTTRDEHVRRSLFAASDPAVGWLHKRYRCLNSATRRRMLEGLPRRDMMRARLDANPSREKTAVQQLFEHWVDGKPYDLRRLDYPKLESLVLLSDWGLQGREGFPDLRAIEEARARRSAVALFEHLVDEAFVGRQSELEELRKHIGVVAPTFWDTLKAIFGRAASPTYVLWGSGGIGKTALIGKLLLTYVESSVWFPLVYQAFDSQTLNVLEPFTLLVAARGQLQAQIPTHELQESAPGRELAARFDQFDQALEKYKRTRDRLSRRGSATRSRSLRLRQSADQEVILYDEFAALLRQVARFAGTRQGSAATPLLWVLDTFEEVMYRTRQDLQGLWRMLTRLCEGCPQLRLIISSRSPPQSLPPTSTRPTPTVRELSDLEMGDAISLLLALGLKDRDVASAIVSQVGCSPLTLRLAARVAAEEQADAGGIKDLQTRRFWLFNVAPQVIRGQLYRRILDHIHDPAVRTLAHPGMVLRRVTPEIIREVLAPICGLEVPSSEEAERLFLELRREHTLVRLDSDASLRYREEIRQPLLELLTRDRPDQVKELHQRAALYYVTHGTHPIERAEEIYHRMMVGEPPYSLEERWLTGVEPFLAGAVSEVFPIHQVWLASHMSLELPAGTESLADLAGWEQQIGRRVLSAQRYGRPRAVLELLNDRKERTPQSPLYAIEARALMDADRAADAARLLRGVVAGWPALGNPGRLAELLWLGSQACGAIGDAGSALRMLTSLCEVAQGLTNKLALVQGLTELVEHQQAALRPQPDRAELARGLDLDASLPDEPWPDIGPVNIITTQQHLAAALDALNESQIEQERSLIRLALVRLGPDYPNTTARAVPLIITDFLFLMRDHWSEQGKTALAQVLTRVNSLEAAERAVFSEVLKAADSSIDPRFLGERWGELLTQLIAQGVRGRPIIEALCLLLSAEGTSLAGVTLAGVDFSREDFQFGSSSAEVMA